jgi:ferredoxin-NADP reductase
MEETTHIVKIISTAPVTHNVKRFTVEKPAGYEYKPGQATEVSINSPAFKDEKRPFTFTSLPGEKHLEFTIKIYTDHQGVTNELGKLKAGDELILRDVWGAIVYNGPGIFIAGGAGVTPFIAIFRQLYKEGNVNGNKLFFSNKTSQDIILKDEFSKMLGENFVNVTTAENTGVYENRRINADYLKEKITNFSQHFYICGPDKFVTDISEALKELGADPESVVVEQ